MHCQMQAIPMHVLHLGVCVLTTVVSHTKLTKTLMCAQGNMN